MSKTAPQNGKMMQIHEFLLPALSAFLVRWPPLLTPARIGGVKALLALFAICPAGLGRAMVYMGPGMALMEGEEEQSLKNWSRLHELDAMVSFVKVGYRCNGNNTTNNNAFEACVNISKPM